MKQKLKGLLTTCLLILVSFNITSCGTPEGNALGALFCELTGGEWVMRGEFLAGGECVRDRNIQEETNKDLEDLKALLKEKELGKEFNTDNLPEESNEIEIAPLSLEECYPAKDEFVLEIINLSKETGSRGVYCHGDYSLKNLSDYKLRLIWRSHTYTGPMESLEYTRPISLPSGAIIKREFDHTTYTDGKKTFDLATGLIVFYDLEECNSLVLNNLDKIIEIANPCN